MLAYRKCRQRKWIEQRVQVWHILSAVVLYHHDQDTYRDRYQIQYAFEAQPGDGELADAFERAYIPIESDNAKEKEKKEVV